jgi:outer membrane protein assembly factor BamE (lipoprotein component of BamABCDE complex)
MKNLLISIIVTITSIGCTVTQGKKTEVSTLESFKKGVTTYDQVISTLGTPYNTQVGDNGKTLFYRYNNTTSQPNPLKFMPIVGGIAQIAAGGDKTSGEYQMIQVYIDNNGKFVRYFEHGGQYSSTSKSRLETAYDGAKKELSDTTIAPASDIKQVGQ